MLAMRTRGVLLVWLAVLIFAAANSIVRKLTVLGAQQAGDGPNPISLCNVLFIGNLCAFLYLSLLFRRDLSRENLAKLDRGVVTRLTVVAALSGALAPALTFSALMHTSVANVVLLGRIEPPLLLVLSIVLLGERVGRWTAIGAAVSFLGVVLTVVLQEGATWMLGRGEVLALFGAASLAFATILGKRLLSTVPIGLFSCVRTGLGTVFFFTAAVALYGAHHFAEAFSPLLWRWMLVYALVVVVGGQLCWFGGVRSVPAARVSIATSFTPVAGLAFAVVLLDERLNTAQIVGTAVIVLGIAIARIDQRSDRQPARLSDRLPHDKGQVGFTGT